MKSEGTETKVHAAKRPKEIVRLRGKVSGE
jgi:hypothetical protein